MNNTGDKNTSSFDDRLDAMLKRRPVSPSGDFASKTLARIHSMPEVTDETIDELLEKMPVEASPDFTARTVRAAVRESALLEFLRPALAAAASVAVCMTGIWVIQTAENPASEPAVEVASAELPQEEDIVVLSRILGDAAPLLDSKASDTLAVLVGTGE